MGIGLLAVDTTPNFPAAVDTASNFPLDNRSPIRVWSAFWAQKLVRALSRWDGRCSINHSLVRLKGPFLGADLASRTAGRAERVKGAEQDRSHAQRSEHGEDLPFEALERPSYNCESGGTDSNSRGLLNSREDLTRRGVCASFRRRALCGRRYVRCDREWRQQASGRR
jgi:hypothetical protein